MLGTLTRTGCSMAFAFAPDGTHSISFASST